MRFTMNGNKPMFELDEMDLEDANAIRFLMRGDDCPSCRNQLPKAWSVLQKYWAAGKDAILISGMDGVSAKEKAEMSSVKWAILRGFVECLAIPERVVARADDYVNMKNGEQGDQGNDDIRIEP